MHKKSKWKITNTHLCSLGVCVVGVCGVSSTQKAPSCINTRTESMYVMTHMCALLHVYITIHAHYHECMYDIVMHASTHAKNRLFKHSFTRIGLPSSCASPMSAAEQRAQSRAVLSNAHAHAQAITRIIIYSVPVFFFGYESRKIVLIRGILWPVRPHTHIWMHEYMHACTYACVR